jgi:hypothetical protein
MGSKEAVPGGTLKAAGAPAIAATQLSSVGRSGELPATLPDAYAGKHALT